MVATVFALAAFSIALLGGLVAGNETMRVLVRALLALVACYPVGLAVGLVCQRIVADHAAGLESDALSHDAASGTAEPDAINGSLSSADVQTV